MEQLPYEERIIETLDDELYEEDEEAFNVEAALTRQVYVKLLISRLINGKINTALGSLSFSTVFILVLSGISITRLTTIMTTLHPRLCRDINLIFFILI